MSEVEDFSRLVFEHRAGLYGFLRSIVRDGAAAEDLAQQSFLKAWKGMKGFKGEASVKNWLYKIALNEARSYLRWRAVRAWLPLGDVDRPETGGGTAEIDRRLAIDEALAKLPPREREVVAMRMEGFQLNEIAEVLGLSVGTVKSYLFFGARKMRETLK